jgi:hypothetical protein
MGGEDRGFPAEEHKGFLECLAIDVWMFIEAEAIRLHHIETRAKRAALRKLPKLL